MTIVLIAIIVVLAAALAAVGARHVSRPRPAPPPPTGGTRRILFPFVANALSSRALDAALRIARAEDATLIPVFLARVPMHLPLDAPLPRQSGVAVSTQEAVEQRATRFGVLVDSRVERGRTSRHALRRAIADTPAERIVIAAAAQGAPGFIPDDVAWLLATAPGEILVLRPGEADPLLAPEPAAPRGPRRTQAIMSS